MNKFLGPLIPILALLGAGAANAADPPEAPPVESPWRFGVALGYGQRSNPVALSDDITIVADIDLAWFGERWFFDNGDLGLTLRDNDSFTLNLIGRFNSDRVFFSKTDSEFITVFDQFGEASTEVITVPDRDYAIEIGLELLTDGRWGYLQAAAHRDVSNTHEGYELFANYGRAFRKNRWMFEPSIGVSFKSKKLNDYYWGVRPHEANKLFQAYTAGAGLNFHGRLQTSYQIDKHWTFVTVFEYERINSEAAASPIAAERWVLGAFTGIRYGF